MAYTLVPTELIVDGAITSAKLDTNIAISGTLGVTGEVTLATHLIMGDNDKIKIGTGGDLEIYHDGSNSYISNSTGNIYLGDTNGAVHIQAKLNEESIICAADGAVTLYHDNSPKLATSSAGVTVTGTLAATLSTAAQTNITSVGTLSSLTVSGDATFDTSTLKVDSTNNRVGIGTSSPSKELDVAVTGNNQASTVRIQGTDGNGNGHPLDLKMDGATDTFFVLIGQGGGATPNTVLFSGNRNGNVGIGTTSPDSALVVEGGQGTYAQVKDGTVTSFLQARGQNSIGVVGTLSNHGFGIYTNSTERMRIDSSGNVGIGTSSPSCALDVVGSSATPLVLELSTGNSNCDVTMQSANTSSVTRLRNGTNDFQVHTNGSERLRLDSAGRMLLGVTSASGAGASVDINGIEFGRGYININRDDTAQIKSITFGKNGSEAGNITTTSQTFYNSASDYRLKENIVEMTDALAKVNQLQPKRFNFIADADTTVDGFIAHEVQEIVPYVVKGEKDGKEIQTMDYGKLTPLLVKAIQEQQTIIDDLKSRIETLEG